MARIPTYERQNLPGGIPQVATPSGRSPIAGGLQVAADAFQDVARADDRFQAAKRQKEEEDAAAWATKGYAQAQLDLGTKYIDLQTEADAKGDGAPGFRGNVEKVIDDYTAKVLENAPTEAARQRLSNQLTLYKAGALTDAMGFEVRSRVAKRTGDMNEAIDLSRNAVSTNPAQFGPALDNMLAGIDALQIPAEKKEILRTRAKNGLAASAIGAQIDRDPAGTLGELRKGEWDQYVDPDQKIGFINGAEAELKRREAEAKAVAREARMQRQVEISMTYDDALAEAQATGKQASVSEADILANFPGKQGQRMVEKLRIASQLGLDGQQIDGQPIAEDVAFLTRLEPKPGTENFADQQLRYEAAAKRVAVKQATLLKDSAGYVLDTNKTVRAAWDAIDAAPEDQRASLRAKAVELTKQAQRDIGLNESQIRVMPQSQAGAIAGQMGSAKPEEVAGLVDQVQANYGLPGLREVQAAGGPQTMQAMAFLSDPNQQVARAKLIEASREPDVIKASLKARGIKEADIGDEIQSQGAEFLNTLPSGTAGNITAAINAVALYNASRGMSASDAAADALKPYTDGFEIVDSYRIPVQFDAGKVEIGLRARIASIDKLDIATDGPAFSLNPNLDPEYLRQETIKAIKDGGYQWLTNEDGSGVVLTFDGLTPVRTKDGKRVEVSFEDAQAMKFRPPIFKGGGYVPPKGQ